MNILPHKSWNVWNKDNIAKVEADEREDQKKKEEVRRKKLAVEQERRYIELRKRKGYSESGKNKSDDDSPKGEHINFFKEFEGQEHKMRSFSNNDFYAGNTDSRKEEADEKMAKERAEAVFLDSVSRRGQTPFYMCTSKEESKTPQMTKNETKRMMLLDPLFSISKDASKFTDPLEIPPPPPKYIKISGDYKDEDKHSHKHKHKRKHHHHHHHHEKRSDDKKVNDDSDGEDEQLKKMRKERLDRERVERIRQDELIKGRFITHSEAILYK